MLEEIEEYWEDDETESVRAVHPAVQAYSTQTAGTSPDDTTTLR